MIEFALPFMFLGGGHEDVKGEAAVPVEIAGQKNLILHAPVGSMWTKHLEATGIEM